MITYLKNENFNELIKEGSVLVDFYADWCGPCQAMEESIEELAKKKESLKIVKVNVDNHMEISREYGVMSIPALFLFKDGKVVKNNVGYLESDELEKFLN